ncbi:Hypothetical protein SCV20265_2513 [Pseudomonas aeruginosa SCV20265]|nr:Hypothetical protein SCV20265_2513 [Pseudomonas aeruginosa SCV20265]
MSIVGIPKGPETESVKRLRRSELKDASGDTAMSLRECSCASSTTSALRFAMREFFLADISKTSNTVIRLARIRFAASDTQ